MVLVIVCQTVSGLLYFVASGGKYLENWLSHKASGYLTEYIAEAGLSKKRRTPLFRTLDRYRNLTDRALQRPEVLAMIKRRAKKVGINPETCSHSLRATGITEYMKNGGTLENAQPQCPPSAGLSRLIAAA